MKKFICLILALVVLSSHDMFLKLPNYHLKPNQNASIELFNGTFLSSDNVIDRNRMVDVSLVGNGLREKVDTAQWRDKDNTTILDFTTGNPGTWVAGVSTKPRNIEMSADDFNNYLEHDGVLDMLEWRKENNALEEDAVEKYSKHTKAIFQVGERYSNDWQVNLGYPIEFIPLSNPYEKNRGDTIAIKLLWKQKPLTDQLVYVGSEHHHIHEHTDDEETHQHPEVKQLRTDRNGVVEVILQEEGIWYLRTIHLVNTTEQGLTHESNWATLTFEIGKGHKHFGFSTLLYWIGGVLLLSLGLLWLRQQGRKRKSMDKLSRN